jgi:hypothetical protein
MASESITFPGEVQEIKVSLPQGSIVSLTQGTFPAEIDHVKLISSNKPLSRPGRMSPMPVVTNESLKKLAAKHPPDSEWFNGEEDRPF